MCCSSYLSSRERDFSPISPKSILLRTGISHTSGPLRSQGFTRGGPTGTSLVASPHHQPCPQPPRRPSLCTQRGQGAETCPQNPWPHVRLGCGTACPSPCPSRVPSVPSSPRCAPLLRSCGFTRCPQLPPALIRGGIKVNKLLEPPSPRACLGRPLCPAPEEGTAPCCPQGAA